MTEPAKAATKSRSGRVTRLLDRYGGQAALRALGGVRRRRVVPVQPANIAVSILGAIGDTLLASAMMTDLRHRYPHATITLVASSTNRIMAGLLPVIDTVLVVPVNRPDTASRMIRSARFDLFIDCNQWLRISAIHAAFADCFTIGFRTPGQYRHFAFDVAVDHSAQRHEVDNFRALLGPLGIEPRAQPRVTYSKADAQAVAKWLAPPSQSPSRLIVFHPWAGGARGALREWPFDHWIALGAELQSRRYRIVITGGPIDAAPSAALVAKAAEAGVSLTSLAGELSLGQVAALLSRAAALVSVNTGTMHLGAALEVPLVALNGPVNPKRWGPLNACSISLLPVGMAGAYLNLGFEYPKRPVNCMPAITPAAALKAVLQIIEQGQEARSTVLSNEGEPGGFFAG